MLENPYWRATFALIIVCLLAAGAAYHFALISPDQWVGWIQAVGSIAAILASVFVAQAQHWREAKTRQDDQAQKRRSLMMLIFPELDQMSRWTFSAERSIAEFWSDDPAHRHMGPTSGTAVFSQADYVPAIPEMMNRLAEQLVLLGGKAALNAVQALEIIRGLNRRAVTTFGNEPIIQVRFDDFRTRELMHNWRSDFAALYRLLEAVMKEISPDYYDSLESPFVRKKTPPPEAV
jgi:hypothetical protein